MDNIPEINEIRNIKQRYCKGIKTPLPVQRSSSTPKTFTDRLLFHNLNPSVQPLTGNPELSEESVQSASKSAIKFPYQELDDNAPS